MNFFREFLFLLVFALAFAVSQSCARSGSSSEESISGNIAKDADANVIGEWTSEKRDNAVTEYSINADGRVLVRMIFSGYGDPVTLEQGTFAAVGKGTFNILLPVSTEKTIRYNSMDKVLRLQVDAYKGSYSVADKDHLEIKNGSMTWKFVRKGSAAASTASRLPSSTGTPPPAVTTAPSKNPAPNFLVVTGDPLFSQIVGVWKVESLDFATLEFREDGTTHLEKSFTGDDGDVVASADGTWTKSADGLSLKISRLDAAADVKENGVTSRYRLQINSDDMLVGIRFNDSPNAFFLSNEDTKARIELKK